jgi:hypothetical protein
MIVAKSYLEESEVRCKRMRRRVGLSRCLSMYVDRNALLEKDKPCWKCPQGEQVRRDYACGKLG